MAGVGGVPGIGRAIALRLAEDGADVAVNDLVDRPREGAALSSGRSASGWR